MTLTYDAHARVEEVMGTDFRPRYAAERAEGGRE